MGHHEIVRVDSSPSPEPVDDQAAIEALHRAEVLADLTFDGDVD
jgi:hypothetical protein